MSHSPLATVLVKANKSNYTSGRQKKIRCITIHHMDGVLSAQQCGGIFQKQGRKASAHYGIGVNGEIGSYVEEEDTAWANSNWSSNSESISIETSDSALSNDYPVSDVTYNSLIRLVADIAKRNNLGKLVKGQNLTWHSMFYATTCPGPYLLARIQDIADKANAINSNTSANTANGSNSFNKSYTDGFLPYPNGYWNIGDEDSHIGTLASWMRKKFPSYTSDLALGNYYGNNLSGSIKEFQKRTNLEQDGSTGPITYAKLKEYGFNYDLSTNSVVVIKQVTTEENPTPPVQPETPAQPEASSQEKDKTTSNNNTDNQAASDQSSMSTPNWFVDFIKKLGEFLVGIFAKK